MKTKVLTLITAALILGSASSMVAGPGAQYYQKRAAKPASTATVEKPANSCCMTSATNTSSTCSQPTPASAPAPAPASEKKG